jgi:hypothetical protein
MSLPESDFSRVISPLHLFDPFFTPLFSRKGLIFRGLGKIPAPKRHTHSKSKVQNSKLKMKSAEKQGMEPGNQKGGMEAQRVDSGGGMTHPAAVAVGPLAERPTVLPPVVHGGFGAAPACHPNSETKNYEASFSHC